MPFVYNILYKSEVVCGLCRVNITGNCYQHINKVVVACITIVQLI